MRVGEAREGGATRGDDAGAARGEGAEATSAEGAVRSAVNDIVLRIFAGFAILSFFSFFNGGWSEPGVPLA